jgi:hypothetical protein
MASENRGPTSRMGAATSMAPVTLSQPSAKTIGSTAG